MPEDPRVLFTHRLVLDRLTADTAELVTAGPGEDAVRLVYPRAFWEQAERAGEIEIDVRVPGLERAEGAAR